MIAEPPFNQHGVLVRSTPDRWRGAETAVQSSRQYRPNDFFGVGYGVDRSVVSASAKVVIYF
jgi:hypothetical protein